MPGAEVSVRPDPPTDTLTGETLRSMFLMVKKTGKATVFVGNDGGVFLFLFHCFEKLFDILILKGCDECLCHLLRGKAWLNILFSLLLA